MRTMKKIARQIAWFVTISVAFAVLCSITAVNAEVVYENDFSMRTSKGAIPYGDWRTVPYTPGKLVNDYITNPFQGTEYQDNWTRANNNGLCPVLVVDDNGNQEVVASCASGAASPYAYLKQRLFNTFSSGIVTAQCDLRAPTTWSGSSGFMFANRFTLGDETFFSPNTASGEYAKHLAASAGITHQNGKRQFWRVAPNAGSVFTDGASVTSWYRIVLTVNLDTRKWSRAFYDLGTAHPTFDTPTPATASFSESDIDMPYDSVTTISAISVAAYCPYGGTGNDIDLSQAAQFDNIRVAHNGEACYVNDFTTRRSRNLAPATTTGTYTADCLVTNTVSGETYWVGRELFPPTTGNQAVPQPVGVDGWRRLNSAGTTTPSVYKDSSDSHLLLHYPLESGKFGVTAVPIGSTLRTGKVRVRADVRTIGIGGGDLATRGAFLYAGGEEFYTCNKAAFDNAAGQFARIGIIGEYTQKEVDGELKTFRRPACRTANGEWVNGTGDEWVKQATWLRFVIEADLDAGTYTAKFLDQGVNQPSSDSEDSTTNYFERAGIPAINPITEISSVGLGAYMSEVKFDNIKVWHRPTGASEETLVYDNSFNPRTIYHQNVRSGRLTGTLWTGPWGQDGWIRTNTGTMNVYVVDDGVNPALAFGGVNYSYSVHDIGTLLKGGTVITQADVTPSECWSGAYRYNIFWLGGDQFHEGNLNGGDAGFVKWTAAGFGFRDTTSTTNSVGQYTNITICAYNGDGAGGGTYANSNAKVDPSHWYRFIATTSMKDSVSDVAVYDLGTDHPTLATPTPAVPVATFANMRSRHLAQDLGGVSCFGMYVNAPLLWNSASTTASLLWDNIRISHKPAGVMVIFR